MPNLGNTALIVVDVQKGFDECERWAPNGRHDNPGCEANVGALIAAWRDHGRPVVYVRHDSTQDGSPLRPGTPAVVLTADLLD